jgi:L-rhamnose-H+ transport protein
VGANPFVGLIYHWIGGFASATNFIPFRQIRRWSWEVYWIIQGFAAWIVAPVVLASIFVPHVFPMLGEAYRAHPRALRWAFLFGVLWGVGGITSASRWGTRLRWACALSSAPWYPRS